jgi:ATP-dependent Clp protease ATP-binding subunit ClpC
MYERFTDRARKVMQLANQEAQRFNHEYIGTEHILLGLIKEGSGVAANVLRNLDVDIRTIRLEVERIVQHGPRDDAYVMGTLPKTPRSKKAIEFAIEEAKGLKHNYVGTEHLLLGLLREEQGVAAQVLINLGMRLGDVREEVLNLLGHPWSGPNAVREAAPAPRPAAEPPAGPPDVLADHIKWLRGLMDRAVAESDFELAAEVRDQRDGLIAFRRALPGGA